jgi:hypothetical protein
MTSWMRVAVTGASLLSAAWMLAGGAAAQENLDAGKSGAQLYQSNCAICHKSAQALNKSGGGLFGLDSFLREHYTSSRESAAAISAYLNTVGGGPADHRAPGKKKVRTEKKKDAKPDAKDGKPSESKPDDKKTDEKKTDEKKPQEKSGETPSDKKPEKKERGKAARLTGGAVGG